MFIISCRSFCFYCNGNESLLYRFGSKQYSCMHVLSYNPQTEQHELHGQGVVIRMCAIPYWLYQFAALLIREIMFLDATISTVHGIFTFFSLKLKLLVTTLAAVACLVSSNVSTRQ